MHIFIYIHTITNASLLSRGDSDGDNSYNGKGDDGDDDDGYSDDDCSTDHGDNQDNANNNDGNNNDDLLNRLRVIKAFFYIQYTKKDG
jgi:hypothetical protein